MGDVAYISAPVLCDFCQMSGTEVQAQYDGATIHGPWAYMCEKHFMENGVGLGTGRGQLLIVGERPEPVPKAKSPSRENYGEYIDDDMVDGTEAPLPAAEEVPVTSGEPAEDKTGNAEQTPPPMKMEWPNP